MVNNEWLYDEKLLVEQHAELHKDLCVTLMRLRALLNLNEADVGSLLTPQERVFTAELEKVAQHAYCKRLFGFEEHRLPESLLAVLQYEFHPKLVLKTGRVPKTLVFYYEYAVSTVKEFRERWNIEPFEDTGLRVGFEADCPTCKEKSFISMDENPVCFTCGAKLEVKCTTTIPTGYEFKEGRITTQGTWMGFCPSNGSEEKAIVSIKKLLGVEATP